MPVIMDGQNVGERAPAIQDIAKKLQQSKQPTVVIDAIDLAGAAEAVHLARAAGAVLDHGAPDTIALFQEQEWLGTTPGEAALRADAVLLVGPLEASFANAETLRRLLSSRDRSRTIAALNTNDIAQDVLDLTDTAPEFGGPNGLGLVEMLGAIRSTVADRPTTLKGDSKDQIATLAKWMSDAKYGVAVFARGAINDLEGHALTGLIDDLSETTRWTALALDSGPGQGELQRMALGLTGLPQPVAFSGAHAVHDPLRFGARNALARNECDFVLWVSASERPVPAWLQDAPVLTAVSAAQGPLSGVATQVDVGVAGVEYDAVLEASELGAFVGFTPQDNTNGRPSAAQTLRAIRDALSNQAEA
jgi:formylmethanofuran dehydrogenase subunit B